MTANLVASALVAFIVASISFAAAAADISPLSIALIIFGCLWSSAVTCASKFFLKVTFLFNSRTPATAVFANAAKFIASLPIPTVNIAKPGPAMKSPTPLSRSLPIPFPNCSNLPPSLNAPIAAFTAPRTFSIAGFNVASPIPAPALVKFAKVLFTIALRVWFNCSFFL